MNPKILLPVFALGLLLSACSASDTTQPEAADDAMSESSVAAYDQNSWETLIPESCLSFFDGCNNCRRNPENGLTACTKKFCQQYEQPVCLDEEMDAEGEE